MNGTPGNDAPEGGIRRSERRTGRRRRRWLWPVVAGLVVERLLGRFDIGPAQLNRPIRDLSHGTKRKLGIVQALMGEPRIAILDEPTSGLDPLMIEAFAEIVSDLRRSGRTAVFLSSHVLSEVEKTCDRVAVVAPASPFSRDDFEAGLAEIRRLKLDSQLGLANAAWPELRDRVQSFLEATEAGPIPAGIHTLGTLLGSGVPILQALTIVRETSGNVIIAGAVTAVHESVKEGETITAPLEASGVFPPMVVSMVDVGEQTGALPEMLLKISDNYDEEVDNAVASMTSLLEPIMIVFLAVVVGSIVIAMFLPLIAMITNLSGAGGGGGGD